MLGMALYKTPVMTHTTALQWLQRREEGASPTELIRDEVLPLNGVPALVARPTAVPQVKLHFPQNGLVMVLNLEEIPISHCPFLLQRDHQRKVKVLSLAFPPISQSNYTTGQKQRKKACMTGISRVESEPKP